MLTLHLDTKLFDQLVDSNPNIRTKLEAIEGDLVLESIGLRLEDENELIQNVNIVFHMAASCKRDDSIK